MPPKICSRYNFRATRYLPRKAEETKTKQRRGNNINLIWFLCASFIFRHLNIILFLLAVFIDRFYCFYWPFCKVVGFSLLRFSRTRWKRVGFFCIIFLLLSAYNLIFSVANWQTVWSYDWFPCCSSVFSLEHLPENLQLNNCKMSVFTKSYLLWWRYFALEWLSRTRSDRKSFVFGLQIVDWG